MMHHVFVYGTLRAGQGRNHVFNNCKCVTKEAFADGFKMLDLGAFPGIIPGDGRIVGEVYEVDEEVLRTLDGIEGFREATPETSLYMRQAIDVFYNDGGTIPDPSGEGGNILTYVFNVKSSFLTPERLESIPIISSGDWVEAGAK